MSENKANDAQLNDKILKFIQPDFENMPIEEVREYLEANNANSPSALNSIKSSIAKYKKKQIAHERLKKAQEQSIIAASKIKKKIVDPALETREMLLDKIRQLLGEESFAGYFRKKDENDMSLDDLKSIIRDFEELGDETENHDK